MFNMVVVESCCSCSPCFMAAVGVGCWHFILATAKCFIPSCCMVKRLGRDAAPRHLNLVGPLYFAALDS